MSKFQQIKKKYSVNPEILIHGKWVLFPDTNIEFKLRPATFGNIEHQAKLNTPEFDMEKKFGKDWNGRMASNPEIRAFMGNIFFGTLITDFRYSDTKDKKDDTDLTVEDLSELFKECAESLMWLLNYVGQHSNFQVLEESEVKN